MNNTPAIGHVSLNGKRFCEIEAIDHQDFQEEIPAIRGLGQPVGVPTILTHRVHFVLIQAVTAAPKPGEQVTINMAERHITGTVLGFEMQWTNKEGERGYALLRVTESIQN